MQLWPRHRRGICRIVQKRDSILRWLSFRLWHLGEDAGDLLLLIVGLPQIVQVEHMLRDLLDFVHIHAQLGIPSKID